MTGVYEDEDDNIGTGVDLIPQPKDPWHNLMGVFKGGFCPAPTRQPQSERKDCVSDKERKSTTLHSLTEVTTLHVNSRAPAVKDKSRPEKDGTVQESQGYSPDQFQGPECAQRNERHVIESATPTPTWESRPREFALDGSSPRELGLMRESDGSSMTLLTKGCAVETKSRFASVIEFAWSMIIILILGARMMNHFGMSFLPHREVTRHTAVYAVKILLRSILVVALFLAPHLLQCKKQAGPIQSPQGERQKEYCEKRTMKPFSVRISGNIIRRAIESLFAIFIMLLMVSLIIHHLHLRAGLSKRHFSDLKQPIPVSGMDMAFVTSIWLASCTFAIATEKGVDNDKQKTDKSLVAGLSRTKNFTEKESKQLKQRKIKRIIGLLGLSEDLITYMLEICWAVLLVLALGLIVFCHLNLGFISSFQSDGIGDFRSPMSRVGALTPFFD
eukprot:CAMPEP_0113549786 /NCGR_PEP_ID=MMETSP0015_2-20120614/13627_1 /TAXON_ID=2838 /ORGANISM="Odontella" /LENGTH=443 /DNA_ID=CAMNT_0000450535 /DNA_START=189 /DNA_END=1520 /DNA_ORIENTATION=+ /assembly_acc=CAM_ASM_000160